MKTIRKVVKTSAFRYQLVQLADGDAASEYAILAPDGEIIDEGLDLREGLATIASIDPPGPEPEGFAHSRH